MSARRDDLLDHAERLVEPPGVTHSSIETLSDEGSAPSAVVRQSRTAGSIGVLIGVVRSLGSQVDELSPELHVHRTALTALLVLQSATAAGLLLVYAALAWLIAFGGP